MSIQLTSARAYAGGMGQAVADRTINRKITEADGAIRTETWEEVSERVSLGNALLDPRTDSFAVEFDKMHHHLRQASLLMSGRHLQHGDENQPSRNLEVFCNCSTSASTFLMFYLLLNGSGVGRCYDDAMIHANLNHMPIVVPVIDWSHPDVASGRINGYLTKRDAEHLYAGRQITTFDVPDSREGWAKGLEVIERMAYENRYEEVLLLEFTGVRGYGSPIKGMQDRPASGPGPLMSAIKSIAVLRDAGMDPWRAAMYADHYAAECVLVGGARRAARMSTKHWKDRTIFDFIELKRGGFLWSSNNSVCVDEEFRAAVRKIDGLLTEYGKEEGRYEKRLKVLIADKRISFTEAHAYRVLRKLAYAAYYDGTGEPGIINQDKLTDKAEGIEGYVDGLFAESAKYKLDAETLPLMKALGKTVVLSGYRMITNPCGEIVLLMLGGYCTIADVVPFHASSDADAEDAFRTAVRALIRVNLMDSLYNREVARTNRIGVGMTGFHEWVYDRFKFTWHDIVNETKSKSMWLMLSRFKRAIVDEAKTYSNLLGVVVPHTDTTFKPAGCASLDTKIKTTDGVLSMKELFAEQGFSNLASIPAGTWLEPTHSTFVLDESNDEKLVTRLYVNGAKEVFEIEFEDGVVAKLTGNHKLKTADGWKRVDKLTENDEIIHY